METDDAGFREMIDGMCAEFLFRAQGRPRQSWYDIPTDQRAGVRRAMFAAYLTAQRWNDEKEIAHDTPRPVA